MTRRFVHYGSPAFYDEQWNEIENDGLWVKPRGGLWASPVGAYYSWYRWCVIEQFRLERLATNFQFELAPDARILELTPDNIWDLPTIPQYGQHLDEWYGANCADNRMVARLGIDFERVAHEYDVLEYNHTKYPLLYWNLYGWDCECILVLNKNVIRSITNE